MTFCTPQSATEEFILLENMFGVSQGPFSLAYHPEDKKMRTLAYMESHAFALGL